MKIIDVHAHIYPEKIARRAADNIGRFYGIEKMTNDGTAKNIEELAQRCGVERIVVCSVATKPEQVPKINDFMASNIGDPMLIPMGALHPEMVKEELIDEIARIKALGLSGVKLHPDFQRFKLSGDKGRKLFDALGELKKPVLVHTGDKRQDYSHPAYMIEIARDYPHITFIAAHFGGWSEWDEALKYKGLRNVTFDTSSSLAFLDPHVAKVVMLGLGVEKFMFGSDYPMWNYAEEIQRVLDLGLGAENNELVFRKNAEKLFGIEI